MDVSLLKKSVDRDEFHHNQDRICFHPTREYSIESFVIIAVAIVVVVVVFVAVVVGGVVVDVVFHLNLIFYFRRDSIIPN